MLIEVALVYNRSWAVVVKKVLPMVSAFDTVQPAGGKFFFSKTKRADYVHNIIILLF